MTNVIIGVLAGALLGAAGGYGVWGTRAAELQERVAVLSQRPAETTAAPAVDIDAAMRAFKRRATIITLSKDPGDTNGRKCLAKVEDAKVNGRQRRKVAWIVDQDEASPCNPVGAWHVELDFTPVNGKVPFPDSTVRVGRDVRAIRIRDTGEGALVSYPYKIFMTGQLLESRYEMADPDLEVEPPVRIAPGNASPATPSNSSPPKP